MAVVKKDNVMFKGVMPALVTPLNEDSTVRTEVAVQMVEWMLTQGVDGFYVLGGTGEGGVLAEKERMRMAEATADIIKKSGKKMILHIGAADTQSAIRLARHAASVGADAISSVYPNFFCEYNLEAAASYYESLIDASGLPMLGYCSKMIQSQNPVTVVTRLMQLDGMIGIKYTFPNYFQMQKIKQLNGGNINVINGPDETLLCGLCMGADGGIGANYNLIPKMFVDVYRQFMANDVKSASKTQEEINKLIAIICGHDMMAAIKYVLEYMGFDVGHTAFPGCRLCDDEKKQIIAELDAAGVLPEVVR